MEGKSRKFRRLLTPAREHEFTNKELILKTFRELSLSSSSTIPFERHKFCFQTVGYGSGYVYCFCECAFVHEFVEYLDEDGVVNQDLFKKTADNISRGRCIHVDEVPGEYTTETSILGAHILSALGKKPEPTNDRTTVFGLNITTIDLLKKKPKKCRALLEKDIFRTLKVARRLSASGNVIQVDHLSEFEFGLQRICKPPYRKLWAKVFIVREEWLGYHLARALELAITYGNHDSQQAVLQVIKRKIKKGSYRDIILSAQTAIVHNELSFFKKIAGELSKTRIDHYARLALTDVAIVLKRKNCCEVLRKFGLFQNQYELGNGYKVKLIVNLAVFFGEALGPEIWHLLNDIQDARTFLTSRIRFDFDELGYRYPYQLGRIFATINACLLQILLQFTGADCIDNPGNFGNTLLTSFAIELTSPYIEFNRFCRPIDNRKTFEILIYENSCISLNPTVVMIAVRIDKRIHSMRNNLHFKQIQSMWGDLSFEGTFIMDATEHSLYGHDGHDNPLNFLAPLLIECGYPVTRTVLEQALAEQLHPGEITYFRHCLDEPRSLKLLCRDTLRNHFAGRAIHRYVSAMQLPKRAREFILLENILKYL